MKCAIGKLGVSKIECLHLHRWSRNGPRCGCSVLGLLGPLWARWLWRAPPAGSCGGYCCLLWLLVADVGPVPHGRSRRKLRSLQSPPRSLCLQSRNGPLSPSKQCQRGSLHFWKWPQTGLVFLILSKRHHFVLGYLRASESTARCWCLPSAAQCCLQFCSTVRFWADFLFTWSKGVIPHVDICPSWGKW